MITWILIAGCLRMGRMMTVLWGARQTGGAWKGDVHCGDGNIYF